MTAHAFNQHGRCASPEARAFSAAFILAAPLLVGALLKVFW